MKMIVMMMKMMKMKLTMKKKMMMMRMNINVKRMMQWGTLVDPISNSNNTILAPHYPPTTHFHLLVSARIVLFECVRAVVVLAFAARFVCLVLSVSRNCFVVSVYFVCTFSGYTHVLVSLSVLHRLREFPQEPHSPHMHTRSGCVLLDSAHDRGPSGVQVKQQRDVRNQHVVCAQARNMLSHAVLRLDSTANSRLRKQKMTRRMMRMTMMTKTKMRMKMKRRMKRTMMLMMTAYGMVTMQMQTM